MVMVVRDDLSVVVLIFDEHSGEHSWRCDLPEATRHVMDPRRRVLEPGFGLCAGRQP